MKRMPTLFGLIALIWAAKSEASSRAQYHIDVFKANEHVTIQSATVKAVAGMSQHNIANVNAALKEVAQNFDKESKQCEDIADGHLWGYRAKIAKILLSTKYLSVVFDKSNVCSGSPSIEREAKIFAIDTGKAVSYQALFAHLLPNRKIVPIDIPDYNYIQPDEESINSMIEDSKAVLGRYDHRCDPYLKSVQYNIWADGNRVVLFPQFLQIYSFCQREYIIDLER